MDIFGMQDKSAFGLLLEEFLSEQNVTKAALARDVGVKPSTISSYVSGRTKPPLPTFNAIADRLGLNEERKEALLRSMRDQTQNIGGIVDVHDTRPLRIFDEWIEEANQCVRILETWIAVKPSVAFAKGFRKAAEKRTPVQVLLIDYNSP